MKGTIKCIYLIDAYPTSFLTSPIHVHWITIYVREGSHCARRIASSLTKHRETRDGFIGYTTAVSECMYIETYILIPIVIQLGCSRSLIAILITAYNKSSQRTKQIYSKYRNRTKPRKENQSAGLNDQ